MPGVHTFYDGSALLQPLADQLGVSVDKVNLVFCQFISLPLAFIQYKLLSPVKVTKRCRLAFPPFIGLIFCYFCFGNAMKHLLANVGISYLLMHYAPPQYVHKIIFLFSMGYLVFIHWYRWYILTTYSIDVTGPMMVIVQKVTVLAFSLHDGRVKQPKELNDIQKREALLSPPGIYEYISYIFCFQTVLTGPMCFFTDYIKWITGDYPGERTKVPWIVVSRKMFQSFFFLFLTAKYGKIFYPEIIAQPEYMKLSWLRWCILFYVVILFQRVQYYYAWTFADTVCNVSGFGFNGYDEHGTPKWDLVSNVNVWKVEMALSFKQTLDSWNCCTMYWLRRVAYDRAPKKYRTVATYMLSAVWHGFFFGYYITFLTGALLTVAGRTGRRCLRFRFQKTKLSRSLYDCFTFVVTKIALAYATFPFVTMHLNPGLFIYRRLYFSVHILALMVIFVLPLIFPPQKRVEKNDYTGENAILQNDEKKTQ